MSKRSYEVLFNKEVIATRMDIRTATILVRALFEEYFNEYPMTVSVREMERCEACEAV